MEESFDLQLRYVGIPTDSGEIAGICLSARDEATARLVFAHLHSYLTSSAGPRQCSVRFGGDPLGGYLMEMDVAASGEELHISIRGVASAIVARLRESLRSFTYYVILAGHGEDPFALLPPGEFHFFKRDLTIDGDTVMGSDASEFDWKGLLREWGKQ